MLNLSALVILTVLSSITLIIHLSNAESVPESHKRSFCFAFSCIIIGALFEWFAEVIIPSNINIPILHAIVRGLEFALAPAVPMFFSLILSNWKKSRVYAPILVINAIMQLSSAWLGFIFYVDSSNVFHRGELFWIFIFFYILTSIIFFIESFIFSRKYQNPNFLTLVFILIFFTSGTSLQLINGSVYTEWLCAAGAGLLLYLYFSDLYIQVDELTGLLNRKCYEKNLTAINYDSAVIMFDVDNFKDINDNYGHTYGDKILKEVADCIQHAYGDRGLCYRIGGDEFCVILKKGKLGMPLSEEEVKYFPMEYEIPEMPEPTKAIYRMNYKFNKLLCEKRLIEPLLPEVSLGYEFFDGHGSISLTVYHADMLMYEKKRKRKNFINRSKQQINSSGE